MAGYLEDLVAENDRFTAEIASISLLPNRYNQVGNVCQAIAESLTP